MQPRTSVRQPVIAGARRQDLSELLRKWRRQPRKRSPLLFCTLLSVALLSDSGLLFLIARLLGLWDSASVAHSSLWQRLTWESRHLDYAAARPALYAILLAVFFFTAAAAARLHWPRWRRRLFFVGLLSGIVCLAWSGTLLGQAVRDRVPTIYHGSLGMLWSASVMVGLGFLLSVVFRDAFLALVGAVGASIGFLVAIHWPLALAEAWTNLPHGAAHDLWLRVQVLTLLSAYAALALAWSIAACTLLRVLLDAPGSERLRRLAALCLWPIRLGVLLLAASALMDGWRALDQGVIWHGWNAQALGTLVLLPVCAAFVYVQRQGELPPLRLLTAVVLGLTFLAMLWHSPGLWESGELDFNSAGAAEIASYVAGLFSLSLVAHAALRYYFGKQRILEV